MFLPGPFPPGLLSQRCHCGISMFAATLKLGAAARAVPAVAAVHPPQRSPFLCINPKTKKSPEGEIPLEAKYKGGPDTSEPSQANSAELRRTSLTKYFYMIGRHVFGRDKGSSIHVSPSLLYASAQTVVSLCIADTWPRPHPEFLPGWDSSIRWPFWCFPGRPERIG